MNDMTSAIVPKSDQINADDLIAGPRVTGGRFLRSAKIVLSKKDLGERCPVDDNGKARGAA